MADNIDVPASDEAAGNQSGSLPADDPNWGPNWVATQAGSTDGRKLCTLPTLDPQLVGYSVLNASGVSIDFQAGTARLTFYELMEMTNRITTANKQNNSAIQN